MFERPILIYSDYCSHSSKFLNLLTQNTELYKSFIRINIDVDPKTKSRPYIFYEIQNALKFKIIDVPTIIVNNAEYILSGEQAFNWLDDMSKQNKEEEQQNDGLSGFNQNEMGSFSDTYASYGSTDLHSNTAEQTFKFLNKNDEVIPTPPEDGSDISPSDYSAKQTERESFANIPNKNVRSNGNTNTNTNNNMNFQMANQQMNRKMGGAISNKQKDMDSRYQQLLQEREQLNVPIQRQ